jgi:hypothetical protein
MEYISHLPGGGWDLQGYFQYLTEMQGRLPPDVFRFAADSRNYDLISHQSLHDAWLESLTITEPATGARSEIRGIQIDCCYLGPYHDVRIHLNYRGVSDYSLTTPTGVLSPPATNIGHGDLLMHEVRIDASGQITHELQFSRGSAFRISCVSFTHRLEQRDANA